MSELRLSDDQLEQLAAMIVRRQQRLMDASEAAEMLGLFGPDGAPLKSWVLTQARAGKLPSIKLGHYTRFHPDELAAWCRARQRGPSYTERAA